MTAGHEPTVYWRPGCVFCIALRLRMRLHKVTARWVKISEDPQAAAFVRSVASGNETVPTVVVGDRSYVNPSWREFRDALSQLTSPDIC